MAGRKLLLADDSITIQKVVNLTFADEGIEVIAVSDGDSAVQRALDENPDIVLADVHMPGLTGYEVCERLRADERTRHIPVILLSGAFEQFDDAAASRVGASAHLTKPFQSIRQLINQVTDLIEAGVPSTPLESEPFEIERPSENESIGNPFDEPVTSQFDSFPLDLNPPRSPERSSNSESTVNSKEIVAQSDVSRREADDIDKLYRQSIGEEPISAGEFPDLGEDDEMIETSYSSARLSGDTLDDPPQFETFHPVEQTMEVADGPIPLADDKQPVSAYETVDLGVGDDPQPAAEPKSEHGGDTIRLDPAMVDAKMAEANRRFEPAEQPPPHHEQSSIGEETIRMDSRFDTQSSGKYEYDDIDLLDLPSESEVEITTPAEAAASGANRQIVTLSPELIEMIAQRVVEKLSEKY